MGGRMARRLLDAGLDLTIYDTSADDHAPSRGAWGAHAWTRRRLLRLHAKSSLSACPLRLSWKRSRWDRDGIAEGSRVKIFIDTSTTGATAARRIAEGLARKNIVAVDSPVSGGLPGAEKGTLAVMVSCPEDILPRLRPILENLGKVFFCGAKPGMGQTMKLLNNLLSATAMAITSEAVVMGVKAGLDPGLIMDVLNAGTAATRRAQTNFRSTSFPEHSMPGLPWVCSIRTFGCASRKPTRWVFR